MSPLNGLRVVEMEAIGPVSLACMRLSTTIEEFVAALDTYIRWYNEARIKVSLGFRSPIEYRRNIEIVA